MSPQETIVALSSAPGKAGVAVIRISGPQSRHILTTITQKPLPDARIAAYRKIYHADGSVLDHALVLLFAAPASFTGEDVVELHMHGGTAIVKACLKLLTGFEACRLAEAGEFTRRAFEHGKIDLLEVEAIADIIDAETEAQARQALRQLDGHAGLIYQRMRAQILECMALLEAYIDFPEEDIPGSVTSRVRQETALLIGSIKQVLETAPVGERIRGGFRIAIIGAPNVGKSTLLNQLAKRDAAIVSPIAGTTRDVIEVHMDIHGYAVILSDTAGIRDTEDVIENLGIDRTLAALDCADIAVFLLDALQPDITPQAIIYKSQKPCICLINKSDIASKNQLETAANMLGKQQPVIHISAASGDGMEVFYHELKQQLETLQPAEAPIVTRERHKLLLFSALQALERSQKELPLELWCEELRVATQKIGEITGIISVDEILGSIFSTFCIGK